MPNNQNTTRRVKDSINFYLNNPKNKPLPGDVDYMRNNLDPPEVYQKIYNEFRYPNPRIKKGGKKNKRKSNKRKSNKRKSNKRKYTIRRRRK